MYKLQVIADKLNIRSTPEADPSFANWVGDMVKGETYTALKIVKGGIFEGTDNWFLDQNNLFTSAASTSINAQEYINDRFDGQDILEPIDYNFLLNINESTKQTKGRGVTIGILDHAISRDIQLKNEIIRPFNVEKPAISHGNFITGIIAGNGEILGLAPNVTIIELPIYDEFGNIREDAIITKIFEFISSFPQKIVLNVSQSLGQGFIERFSNLKNAIIVASAKTNESLIDNNLVIPANLPNVISVGSITQDFRNQQENLLFNPRLDFILPVFKYVSYSISNNKFRIGTDTSSVAAAVVSSIIGLLYSGQTIPESSEIIQQEVSNLSKAYKDKTSFNSFNVINPPK